MNIEISRFRQVEELLIELLGAESADTVCCAIALCAVRPISDPAFLDEVTIRLPDVAMRLGLDLQDASERLKRADALLDDAFGVNLLSSESEIFDPHPLVSLHADFVDVVRGISVGVQPNFPSRPRPDAESQKWIDLIARASACGAAAPILYRCVRGCTDRLDEISDAASALSLSLDGGVTVLDPNAAGRGLALAAMVLSALLNQPSRVLVVAGDVVVPPRGPDHADENPDDGGERPRGTLPLSIMSGAGERLLAVAAAAKVVVIIPVAADARFAPKVVARVVGAVGPLRYDRAASIAAVKGMAPWPLSDALAGRIVTIYPEIEAASRLLAAAGRLAVVGKKGASQSRRRRGTATECNALATSLVRGIEPHLATTRSMRPSGDDEPFHPELITCEHRELLLDPGNGDRLRDAGIRVGLFGVAGTGKTKFAAAIAANLKCQALQVQSSDILAYRLGQLEKNLRDIFQMARELNAVLIFDEFDSIASSRAEAGSASYIVSLTNSLLVELDGHSLPVITASNFFSRIDPAIRRRYDISTELQPIPEYIEPKAFKLMLGFDNHSHILGRTCVSDYSHARKIAFLTGDDSLNAAVEAVRKAREIRLGEGRQVGKIGFI